LTTPPASIAWASCGTLRHLLKKRGVRYSPTDVGSFLEQPQWQVTYMPRVAVAPAATGPFRLDPLPCLTNAFEPYIDGKTMEIHHDRHH
jgi:superoxide dismutase, Fe-Mn family